MWRVWQGARDAAPLFALSRTLVLLTRVPAHQLAAPQEHMPSSISSFIIFHYAATSVCCSHYYAAGGAR